MKNNIVIGIVVVALVLAGLFSNSVVSVIERVAVAVENVVPFGGASGPTHNDRQFFNAGFQSGGDVYATSSTAATYTLTNTEFKGDISYISWTANINTTLTTMASTSPVFDAILGHNAGDTRSYLFYNASTTAGATVTFAAGTGVDLQEDEGGSVIVNGLELSKLTFIRKVDSDIILLVEPYEVGD